MGRRADETLTAIEETKKEWWSRHRRWDDNGPRAGSDMKHGFTDVFITPGYRFKYVDGLITNFHLPKSTLLVLVSAFAGRENILRAYHQAIAHEYRFYSFGDAMLIV